MIPLGTFILVCAVAALALGGWMASESALRTTRRALDEAERDLDTALGWNDDVRAPVVLQAIEGGRDS